MVPCVICIGLSGRSGMGNDHVPYRFCPFVGRNGCLVCAEIKSLIVLVFSFLITCRGCQGMDVCAWSLWKRIIICVLVLRTGGGLGAYQSSGISVICQREIWSQPHSMINGWHWDHLRENFTLVNMHSIFHWLLLLPSHLLSIPGKSDDSSSELCHWKQELRRAWRFCGEKMIIKSRHEQSSDPVWGIHRVSTCLEPSSSMKAMSALERDH